MTQVHSDLQDVISWKWTKNGKFSVKSTYEHLTRDDMGESHSKIWNSKVPYKIKIFLWLLAKKATLTKDNMVKRKWAGDPTCRFYDATETVDHLFFQCPTAKVVWGLIAICLGANTVPSNICQFWRWMEINLPGGKHCYTLGLTATCWAIWKTRNKACFEYKLIKHPAEIMYYVCSLLKF